LKGAKDMLEIKMKGEELNGLGLTLKQIMDETIQKPEVMKSIKKLRGSMVVRETGADVAVTIFLNKGDVQIQNDAIEKPSAYVAGGFEELAAISSGQMGPVRALITGKIKAGGNLIKLLRMSKIIILRE
jgi:putative sterol carrier protein